MMVVADDPVVDEVASPTSLASVGAVGRGWSHVDHFQMLGSFGAMSIGYNLLIHPVTLAITRQQCSHEVLSMVDVLRGAYRASGCRGLFRGSFISCFAGLVTDTSFFYILEVTKEISGVQNQEVKDFLAGIAAESMTTPLYMPFTVVMTRQIVAGQGMYATVPFENSIRTIQRVANEGGWQALLRGTGISLVCAPIVGAWWLLYGITKQHMYRYLGVPTNSLLRRVGVSESMTKLLASPTDSLILNSASGCTTSASVAILSNPLVVLRSRLQVMDFPRGTKWRIATLCRDIVRREGLSGFLKGLRANLALNIVVGSGFGAAYEGTKQFAQK